MSLFCEKFFVCFCFFKGVKHVHLFICFESKVFLPPTFSLYRETYIHPQDLDVQDDEMVTGKEISVFCFIEMQLFNKPGDNNSQTILRSKKSLRIVVLKLDRSSDSPGGLVKIWNARPHLQSI